MFGNVGLWQLILIVFVMLIFFGAGKLPTVMSDIAKGIKSFKKTLNNPEDTPKTGNTKNDNDTLNN